MVSTVLRISDPVVDSECSIAPTTDPSSPKNKSFRVILYYYLGSMCEFQVVVIVSVCDRGGVRKPYHNQIRHLYVACLVGRYYVLECCTVGWPPLIFDLLLR